ncbi:MAG: hypothetical protein O2921_07940 [Chloroflexi bacterium]|nr:hypothetical protein [Chloroflexota bacterium]
MALETMNSYLKSAARNLHLSVGQIAIIASLLIVAASVACGSGSVDDDGIVAEGLSSPR